MSKVLALDIFVDYENPLEALKQLVRKLRPEWNADAVTYEDKSTGYINRNLRVYVPGNNEALLLRLIITGFDPKWIEGQKQIYGFMDQVKLGPELYCYVRNGMCTEFYNGKFLTWDDRGRMYEENTWPRTAEVMALYHCEDIYNKAKAFGMIDKSKTNFKETVGPPLDALKGSDPESDFCQRIPSGLEYEETYDWFVRTADKICPDKRFVHQDANPTNWLLRENDVKLVDYDATGIFYPSGDIAWFFLLHCDYRNINLNEYPSLEYQRKWLRRYLTKRRALDGETQLVSDEDVEKLYQEVETVGMLFALFQVTFSSVLIMVLNQKGGTNAVTQSTTLICWDEFKRRRAELTRQGYD